MDHADPLDRVGADLEANDRRSLADPGSGLATAAERSEAVDRVLAGLFAPLAEPGLALVATGGYGRSQLGPGSDVDLLLLHAPGLRDEAGQRFSSVLYPLWDAGLRVGHASRTPGEAADPRDLRTLTSMLSARLLGGDGDLLEDTSERVAVSVSGSKFVQDLRASRVEREARAGRVGESQAPDLRDGLGGLRDLHVLGWLNPIGGGPDPEGAAEAEDLLWRVRIALHRTAGGSSNILGEDHHAAVADLLGLVAEPGWEARDVLMRMVHDAGRRIDWMTVRTIQGLVTPRGSTSTRTSALSEGGWDVAGREEFVRILAGDAGFDALIGLDATGQLNELIPEWSQVRGRPQRDPFHRFPVDVHLIETAAHVSKLMYRPDEPFAQEAVGQISDPGPLLLGAFLHDIGKVGRGSHVLAGVEIAARVLDRMGIETGRRETILFLVREHLLLSEVATRRDLDDEDLILHVAARIGDPERLAMLYLLTVADALATGPAASTPWRMGLIRDLVAKVSHVFERGDMDRDRAARLEAAERGLRKALGDSAEAHAFLNSVPPAYVLWADPADAPGHLRLVAPRPGANEVRMQVRPTRTAGTFALTLSAVDRPGLLARVAGALTLSGLSVLQAQAFTTEYGVALDAFEVGPAFNEEIGEDRWRRFRTTVRHAIEGRIDVRDRIERLREHYRPVEPGIPISVRIDHRASDFFTVVEVGAADRLGLLFDLARTFSAEGLDVHLAKVATYGPRVVDVFYVTDATGQKVGDPGRTAALERALEEAAR